MRHLRALFVKALFLLITLNCSNAQTGQPEPKQPEIENKKIETNSKEIESFWTEENMRNAKPKQAEKVIPQPENSTPPSQPNQKKEEKIE